MVLEVQYLIGGRECSWLRHLMLIAPGSGNLCYTIFSGYLVTVAVRLPEDCVCPTYPDFNSKLSC